jgi:hypothetical protein
VDCTKKENVREVAMNSPWEPGIAQAMQRHGGSNHSVPKVSAPNIQPEVKPLDRPMVVQGAPLTPADPQAEEEI